MCAVPESHAPSRESFDGQMCAPGQPHLLRIPNLDLELCTPVSGKAAGAEAYAVATRALGLARELEGRGQYDEALLNYRVIDATVPRIRDYAGMLRGQLHRRAGDPERAAAAYREALEATVNVDLSAHLHLELVRSLLAAGDAKAERELDMLLRRYPHLPEAPLLKLDLAGYREKQGAPRTAAATYRMLDLTLPGYPVAAEARARLKALAEQGVTVVPFTQDQRLGRAEQLVHSGPVELARAALSELADEKLTSTRVRVLQGLEASLDRVDASVGASAPADRDGRSVGDPDTDARAVLRREAAQKRVRGLVSKHGKITKVRPFQLLSILHAAIDERVADVADVVVRELARRGAAASADARFDALSLAAGSASDDALVELATTLVEHRSLGAAALYHRGRALERAGQTDAARADFTRVQLEDRSTTHFYATWADQRLRALAGDTTDSRCAAGTPLAECAHDSTERALRALDFGLSPDTALAVAILTHVDAEHGAAYPWFGRALDLARIGEFSAATDELHEAYLAYRSITHRGALRTGREAVYRGTGVMRRSPDAAVRRARLALGAEDREKLARAASALGDYGTAAFFGGARWAESHPHPYPREVAAAARKHHVDPDLLFAVMRVESVYQSRIISYAGAVGLMQIMPRTGRLIADRLGQHGRTTTDLLNPEINVEYAAWYLRSLLDRMDGHLPLAIASYNGGPHNVRKWLRSNGQQMPLDAFLERIPFTQTKRYVRRVLGYYVEYKALRGEKIELMAVTLPGELPTDVTF